MSQPQTSIIDLDSDELWKTSNKLYSEWICNLTYVICNKGVKDEVFKLCADICKNSSEFAEFIFPHLFEDLLLVKEYSFLPNKINNHILSEKNENKVNKNNLILFFDFFIIFFFFHRNQFN